MKLFWTCIACGAKWIFITKRCKRCDERMKKRGSASLSERIGK